MEREKSLMKDRPYKSLKLEMSMEHLIEKIFNVANVYNPLINLKIIFAFYKLLLNY